MAFGTRLGSGDEGLIAESHDCIPAIEPAADMVVVEVPPPDAAPEQAQEAPAAVLVEEPRLREDQEVDPLRHAPQELSMSMEEDGSVGVARLEPGLTSRVRQLITDGVAAVHHLFCLEELELGGVDLAVFVVHRLALLGPVGLDRGGVAVDHTGGGHGGLGVQLAIDEDSQPSTDDSGEQKTEDGENGVEHEYSVEVRDDEKATKRGFDDCGM